MLTALDIEADQADQKFASMLPGVRRLGVAFSGGVDSSVLLALAVRALGRESVIAILGVSPSLAEDERRSAHDVAAFIGADLVEVVTREGDRPAYQANGPDRCFHCKDELFATISDQLLARAPTRCGRLRRERRRRQAARPSRGPGRDQSPGAATAGRCRMGQTGGAGHRPDTRPAVREQTRSAMPGLSDPPLPNRDTNKAAADRAKPRAAFVRWGSAICESGITARSPASNCHRTNSSVR